jgi:desulfoferrodoxin (superoxide reductase-like protein)
MQLQVPEFGEGTFCSWLKLQVPHSVRRLCGLCKNIKKNIVFYINWKSGTGIASTKLSFCNLHGFQGRPWFGHITTLQNGPLYF